MSDPFGPDVFEKKRRNPFRRKRGRHSMDRPPVVFRSVRERPRRMSFFRRRWVIVSLVILLLLGGGAGYGAYHFYRLQGNVTDEDIITEEQPDDDPENAGFNVLLVGSDSRKGLTDEEKEDLAAGDVGGERADTLILARIDPADEHVTMVQFPRDLYVITPDGSRSKINETLARGDNYLIETVKKLTGLPINHYAKINIAGFRDLVDAIDGVEVCIPDPIPFDPHTGIEVTEEETGMVEFDGDRALRFVRSRNYETGDFERIQNQQKFLAAAINKVTSVDTILRFDRITALYGVAEDNIKIDKNTSLGRLYEIVQRFRAFSPGNYEAYTAPNFGTTTIDGISIVQPDLKSMKVMFEAIAKDESPASTDDAPEVDPTTITLGVYNGTGKDGAAESAADALVEKTATAAGTVTVAEIGDASRQNHVDTVVRYSGGDQALEKARYIAAALPGATVEEGKTPLGIDVAVIVGKRFVAKQIVQIAPIPIPEPGELPPECR